MINRPKGIFAEVLPNTETFVSGGRGGGDRKFR